MAQSGAAVDKTCLQRGMSLIRWSGRAWELGRAQRRAAREQPAGVLDGDSRAQPYRRRRHSASRNYRGNNRPGCGRQTWPFWATEKADENRLVATVTTKTIKIERRDGEVAELSGSGPGHTSPNVPCFLPCSHLPSAAVGQLPAHQSVSDAARLWCLLPWMSSEGFGA